VLNSYKKELGELLSNVVMAKMKMYIQSGTMEKSAEMTEDGVDS
jgi:hypothetical protein